jgi:cytidylate kinase
MIIAIDGPAASGKSTVAKALASRLSFGYLDTGAMYRAVAYAALRDGLVLDDEVSVAGLAERSKIAFEYESGEALPSRVLLDGSDVTEAIRTPQVDASVSRVARIPSVRSALVTQQRAIAAEGDFVVEGRDIGTVVFPDAGVKVFLTASSQVRASRRHVDLTEGGYAVEADVVEEGIAERDRLDSAREASPLTPADDAHHIDTSALSPDEVVDHIAALVQAG